MSNEILRLGPAYCAVVVDASGSMSGKGPEVTRGVNEQALALLETATDRTHLALFTFNTQVGPPAWKGEISDFSPLEPAFFRAEGDTALLDAIGRACDELEPDVESPRHKAAPATGLVVVFTDGEENSSRRETVESIRQRITRLRATGRWTFVLVGPQYSLDRASAQLGIPRANAFPFGAGNVGARGSFQAATQAIAGYMDARARGIGASEEFFAGVLPPSSDEP